MQSTAEGNENIVSLQKTWSCMILDSEPNDPWSKTKGQGIIKLLRFILVGQWIHVAIFIAICSVIANS